MRFADTWPVLVGRTIDEHGLRVREAHGHSGGRTAACTVAAAALLLQPALVATGRAAISAVGVAFGREPGVQRRHVLGRLRAAIAAGQRAIEKEVNQPAPPIPLAPPAAVALILPRRASSARARRDMARAITVPRRLVLTGGRREELWLGCAGQRRDESDNQYRAGAPPHGRSPVDCSP